jgi:3-deoxy-7-phosphoheptulonate synthase
MNKEILLENPITNNTAKTQVVSVGDIAIGAGKFTVIAGPCSIESHDLFSETAQAVKKRGAVLLRGGVWKMRTSPQAFQGLGASAFDFIKEVLQQTGLSFVAEITDPRQMELLEPIVSMYQVGSRNMHNYALLRELGQSKHPVLLKRGFAAYVDEWIKAAEYVHVGGNPNVILCERGIRTFETATRNTLDLNAVAYIKSRTSFPVIVDPSHAVGVRDLVSPLALAAAAVGADGIIVEVHPRPAQALSDGPQALTFDDFQLLMQQLEKITTALGRPLQKL